MRLSAENSLAADDCYYVFLSFFPHGETLGIGVPLGFGESLESLHQLVRMSAMTSEQAR